MTTSPRGLATGALKILLAAACAIGLLPGAQAADWVGAPLAGASVETAVAQRLDSRSGARS